jgi:putative spermidine/putrescine transport system permease protein
VRTIADPDPVYVEAAAALPSPHSPAREAAPGKGVLRWPLFGLVGLYLALPIVATVLYSLATVWRNTAFPDGLTLRWWEETLSDGRLLDALARSVIVAVIAVVLIAAITLPPLYWSYVRNPRLRTVMQIAALLPFALPFVVLAYGMKSLAGLTAFTEQYEASKQLLVLGHVALAFPFFFWPVDAAMAGTGVKRLHEAAEVSGASPATTLARVVVPGIKVGIILGALLAFATSFGEYSIAQVITGSSYETLPVWQVANLKDTRGNPNGVAVMATFVFILFFLVALIVARLGKGEAVRLLPGVDPTKQR